MDVQRFDIDGLVRLTPRAFDDARGAFYESYTRRLLEDVLGPVDFVQDNHSISKRGVVRGLHFQIPPKPVAKLVRVAKGAVLDVAVDLRAGSPTFGRHLAIELSAANRHQLFVPRGFAHGFCALEDDTVVLYKVDEYFSPEHDRAMLWNDPDLGITWPVDARSAIVSGKDAQAPRLRDLGAPFGAP
jgi:dTDP-4-dehydrorhamnose 3,5-epimerase